MNIQSPSAVETIDLVTNVRKPIAFDIELQNPLEEQVTFEVFHNGVGLVGEQYFSVLPYTSVRFCL